MPYLDLASLLDGPPPKRAWLVEGLLPSDINIILASHPGVGKSFLALDLSLALVSGQSFLGRHTDPNCEPQRVLYVDEENDLQTIHERMFKLSRGRGLEAEDLENFHYLHMEFADCSSPGDVAIRLIPHVKKVEPDLLVIDTWPSLMPFEDENSNSESALALRALKRVRAAHPYMTCLILCHLDKKRGDVRGAGHLKGATDATFRLLRSGGAPKKGGWSTTDLVADKIRAANSAHHIRIFPSSVGEEGVRLFHKNMEIMEGPSESDSSEQS